MHFLVRSAPAWVASQPRPAASGYRSRARLRCRRAHCTRARLGSASSLACSASVTSRAAPPCTAPRALTPTRRAFHLDRPTGARRFGQEPGAAAAGDRGRDATARREQRRRGSGRPARPRPPGGAAKPPTLVTRQRDAGQPAAGGAAQRGAEAAPTVGPRRRRRVERRAGPPGHEGAGNTPCSKLASGPPEAGPDAAKTPRSSPPARRARPGGRCRRAWRAARPPAAAPTGPRRPRGASPASAPPGRAGRR